VANEGAWKLYKGSKAHFFRTAPHYAAMFAILEGTCCVSQIPAFLF
jgi:hypothetical protein